MIQMQNKTYITLLISALALSACGGGGGSSSSDSRDNNAVNTQATLSEQLTKTIESASPLGTTEFYKLPASDDFDNIPQDPKNPITTEKVMLGQHLFHDTGFGTETVAADRVGTYSCASCHHAAAGFKAGIPQGIADGGMGFGISGEERVLQAGLSGAAPEGDPLRPDIQPFTSPTVLNVAYQDVMLWNGQFGNSDNSINRSVDPARLATVGTPKAVNLRELSGVETQAIAGIGVHRQKFDTDSLLQTNPAYQMMLNNAFPTGNDDLLKAGLAMAAFERTILANEAPFQQWLNGDDSAMNDQAKRGAIVFFGEGGCAACHSGPALSSAPGATNDDMFFAIGFNDFDINDPRVNSTANEVESRGRGGFNGNPADDYKFKIPQLYNLIDTSVFGHGGSFKSVREVVEYKNAAQVQNVDVLNTNNLAPNFVPLLLSDQQVDDLVYFLENSLYDANLERYVPDSVVSGHCFPVADTQSKTDLGCPP